MKGYIRKNSRFWTREEAVDCIRQLHASGVSLRHAAMIRENRKLYRAATTLFGTWRDAVAQAGLDGLLPHRHLWSRDEILARIRKREAKGLALNYQAVKRSDPKLALAGKRHFGTWGSALQTAGCNALAIAKWRRWTDEQLIDAIQRRASAGKPLSSICMQREQSGIFRAGTTRFGSWDDVLRAAGFSPEQHRRQGPHWTRSRLLAYILERRAAGDPLNAGSIKNSAIHEVAKRHFGSWDNALLAARINPAQIRLHGCRWTRKQVISRIRARQARGQGVNAGAVQKGENVLYQEGHRLFGSWDRALRASGLDPLKIRRARAHWTRMEVIAALSDRAKRGLPLTTDKVRPFSLHDAAVRFYGSWLNALHAADLSPAQREGLRIYWNRDRIIREIRKRQQQGRGLNYAAVRSEDPKLLSASMDHFGNWSIALEAAELRADQARKNRGWSRSKVIRILRTRARAQGGSSFEEQGTTLNSVWYAAQRLFGSWVEAHRAAGLPGTWRRIGRKKRFVPQWSADAIAKIR